MKRGWKVFLGIIGAVILLVLGAGIYRGIKKANEGKNGNGNTTKGNGNGDENDTKSGG
ncbi:hypothetical protein [Flavihumibacter sp. CACIAM 22H1]|uniref:hypothetical protein n=1 Tax=Flavihumibacter sp. CACIAM 22H1 TaxID=1812911 RepID=UPI000ACA6F62|nr:hypothetical protein [Flavihumibacter sp. CACIAM 22H1]